MASAREEAQRLIEEGLDRRSCTSPIRKHPLVPWAQWQTEDPPDSLVERWLGREFEGADTYSRQWQTIGRDRCRQPKRQKSGSKNLPFLRLVKHRGAAIFIFKQAQIWKLKQHQRQRQNRCCE